MVNETPPRLSQAAWGAIRDHLAKQRRLSAVPVSRVLRNIRTSAPALWESDEDLIQQIVMDAADHGLALHFDKHTKERWGAAFEPGTQDERQRPEVHGIRLSETE